MVMNDRELLIKNFLNAHGWGDCHRTPIKGDASLRRYERLRNGSASVILMDAPPKHEDVRPFISIGKFLSVNHFSAPTIYASDIENGFLLLEDFGDDVYGSVLSGNSPYSGSVNEEELYRYAVDVLSELHRVAPPLHIPHYDETRLLNEALMMVNWYLPVIIPDPQQLKKAQDEYLQLWKGVLSQKQALPDVLVMRDYHSPNLMWLPEREGVKKVGLLDFQDAVIGSPAYDLTSLLADARRDVAPEVSLALLQHYLNNQTHINQDAFLASYAILGVQRNLKVIGFLTRKLYSENNASYLHLFPRMWRYMEPGLKHPALAPIKEWLDRVIPEDIRNLDILTSHHKEYARA